MELRIGAMVLGFIGGIGGYMIGILAVVTLIIGSVLQSQLGQFFGAGGLEAGLITFPPMLIAFLPISIIGVVGAAITLAKPFAAGILMLVSAILMPVVGITVGGMAAGSFSIESIGPMVMPTMFSSILLIIAGILALVPGREETW